MKKNKIQGKCHLCGSFGDLTFEHVPPRGAFNKNTRYQQAPILDILQMKNPFEPTVKSIVEQGGVGYYSLCNKCNNFLGTNYVKSYQAYSNSFIDSYKKSDFQYFEFIMHDFEALKVLKQIVSMFFSINNSGFLDGNRDLAKFVLDPSSKDLPSRFRVFNYLAGEGQLRNIPIGVKGNLETGYTIVGSEMMYPPLGHLLLIGFKDGLNFHQEITSFKNYSQKEKIDFSFKIYRLPTHLPFLFDYRDRATIELEMK